MYYFIVCFDFVCVHIGLNECVGDGGWEGCSCAGEKDRGRRTQSELYIRVCVEFVYVEVSADEIDVCLCR